jgi:hypothetical protein
VDDSTATVTKAKGKSSRKNAASSRAGEHASEGSDVAIEELESSLIEKAKARMDKAIDWFQTQAFDGVERGKGRITPG